jgi:hypothetical protein
MKGRAYSHGWGLCTSPESPAGMDIPEEDWAASHARWAVNQGVRKANGLGRSDPQKDP